MKNSFALGSYRVVLERVCWTNNITGHAIYTEDIRGKCQKRGTYFLGTNELVSIRLNRKQIGAVRKFLSRLNKK